METLEERRLLAVVSYWDADNRPVDSVGPNDGTLVSGASYAAGQIGQAFSFDGVDDRVLVADDPSLALTGSMTIEAWVKADSIPTTGSGLILFRGDDRGGLDPYQLRTDNGGQIRFSINDDVNSGSSVSAPMPLGEFVYVAATLDDATGEMTLYLNGVQMSQNVTAVRPFGALDPASNPGIGIGNHGGFPTTPHNFPFDGLIDELKVHDQALTAADVLANFNAGKGSLQPSVSISDVTVTEGDESIQFIDAFITAGSGGLDAPLEIVTGPEGNLYISSRNSNEVLRFNATTGALIDAFVTAGSGGLFAPRAFTFGADGNLYVVSGVTDSVLRYQGPGGASPGAFIDAFVSTGSGGLDRPYGLAFGSDGNLYVGGLRNDGVLRYDGASGAFIDVFVSTGSGGLNRPRELAFAADGNLYVVSTESDSILRYDGTTGAFIDAFVPTGSGGLDWPVSLTFGPGGDLYVSCSASCDGVLRYDGTTGAFVEVFVFSGSGGLDDAAGPFFDSDGNLYVASAGTDEVLRYGAASDANFTVRLSSPNPNVVTVNYATADGTANAGSDYVATSGTLTFQPGETSKIVAVPIIDNSFYEPDETFVVNLSSPTGATLSDAQGVGTIVDDEQPPIVELFADSFEISEWNGNWVEDNQNDWKRTSQRAIDGSYAAEVDGWANNANLTLANPIDLTSFESAELTFSWYIEKGFDSGEYIALDFSNNGGSSWTEVAILKGNVDQENTWINETIAIGGSNLVNDFQIRFRAKASRSNEDGFVDNVKIIGTSPSTPNTAPVATNDVGYNVNEDGVLNVTASGVLANDTDADSDPLTAILVNGPSDGALTLNGDGSFTYTPSANFNGSDSFTYKANDGAADSNIATVSITVNSVNDAAVAGNDSYSVNQDTPLNIPAAGVLVNDSDFDGDTLTAILVAGSGPSNGSLTLNSDGSFVYTPNAGFYGSDSFSYRANDSAVDSNAATVSITVTPNQGPAANADADQTVNDDDGNGSETVTLNGSGSDSDGTIASYEWKEGATVLGTTASITPTLGVGVHTLTLTVVDNDGASATDTVLVTVNANQGPIANAGADQTVTDGNAVTLNGSGSDSDGAIVSYEWKEGATVLGTTASISPTLGLGIHSLTLTVTDNGGAMASDTVVVTVDAVAAGPKLAHGIVKVGNSWQTVTLSNSYTSMVVVATPNYDSSSAPAVVRIRSAAGSSFEIRVDAAGPNSVGNINVNYVVVEEGVYDEAGYKMEAVKYDSTVTDENNSWGGESRSYGQSYSAPVVLGQVMTYNDPDWSVFWASGSSRQSAPTSSVLTVGKHVGEDADATRANETVGYIVIETNTSGTATIDGLPYVAALGGDTIKGVGDSPSYNYTYNAMENSKTAIATQAGMDGNNGGWAVLYGTDPITPTGSTLKLAIEEDQNKDTERRHTTEQVAYFIIDPPVEAAAEAIESVEVVSSQLDTAAVRLAVRRSPELAHAPDHRSQATNGEHSRSGGPSVVDLGEVRRPALSIGGATTNAAFTTPAYLRVLDELFAEESGIGTLLDNELLEQLL